MTDMNCMTIGQIVDMCIAYNDRQKQANKTESKQRRRATQRDINAFFG